MATSETVLGQATGYPYSRGLDYLRRHTPEHTAVAHRIIDHWFGETPREGGLRLCDYGAGFGDLSHAVLDGVAAKEPPASVNSVTTIDRDARLADFAARRLRNRAGEALLVRAGTQLDPRDGCFDLVLAAHVLYYVSDRAAVVSRLATQLGRAGALTIVIRADTCDTFAIRSALRGSERTPGDQVATPRVTDASVKAMLAGAGLRLRHSTVALRLTVPRCNVRLDDLLQHRPSTDETELLRFLGHFDAQRHGDASATVFAAELDRRLEAGRYAFDLRTSVITGTAPD